MCRRFGVSPTIGYKLLARWRAEGKAGLANRSRRPQYSPGRSATAMEGLVLAVRDEHPAWGGRKIRRRLQDLPFDYGPEAIVRRVDADGWMSFRNRPVKLGRAFAYHRVALRPTDQDGCFDVLFCTHRVGAVDLREVAP